jgi:hypothetical protein
MGRDTFVRVQWPKSKVFGPIGRHRVGGGTGTPGRDTLFHREKPGEIDDHPQFDGVWPGPIRSGREREKDGTGHVGTGPATGHRMAGGSGHFDSIGS